MKNKITNTERKRVRKYRKYGATGTVLIALILSACGQQDISEESGQGLGIPLSGTESFSDSQQNVEDFMTGSISIPDTGQSSKESGLLQPTYIGNWKVTDYCYPSTPCGLSQMEVDILVGSELIYTQESFTCNQKVFQSEVFDYEFWDCNNLTEYEQGYNVSVEKWFEEGNTGKVKCGYLTMEDDIFGNRFAWMEEQPDKMMIYYYGVIFLAVNDQAQADPETESPRDSGL